MLLNVFLKMLMRLWVHFKIDRELFQLHCINTKRDYFFHQRAFNQAEDKNINIKQEKSADPRLIILALMWLYLLEKLCNSASNHRVYLETVRCKSRMINLMLIVFCAHFVLCSSH